MKFVYAIFTFVLGASQIGMAIWLEPRMWETVAPPSFFEGWEMYCTIGLLALMCVPQTRAQRTVALLLLLANFIGFAVGFKIALDDPEGNNPLPHTWLQMEWTLGVFALLVSACFLYLPARKGLQP